jgi:arsenate reductase (thioredoxin)
MTKVIFACVHNAGRSQMAAAWFNRLVTESTPNSQTPTPNSQLSTPNARGPWAISAGTAPGERVHPEVVAVMKEVGIDLSSATPRKLTAELAQGADLLVTMGCGDECPYVPGLKIEDWPLEDPKGKPIERVREIRDEIRRRVEGLLR